MTPSSQIPSVQTLHAVQGRLLAALADIPEIAEAPSSVWTLGQHIASGATGIEVLLYRSADGMRALEAAAAIIGGTVAPVSDGKPFPVRSGWRRWHRLLTEQEGVRVEIHAALPVEAPDQDETEPAPPAAAPGEGGPGPQDATVQLRDAEPIHLTGWQLLHTTTGEGQGYTQLTGWVTGGQLPQASRCGMVWAYLPDHCPHTLAGARDVRCEVAYGPGPRPHLTLRWPTRPADRADHYTGAVA